MIELTLLSALGYICGIALSFLVSEEIKHGRKYLWFLSRAIFLVVLAIVFHPVVFLLAFFPFRWESAETILYAAASGIIISIFGSPLIAALSFILGLPLGSINKKLVIVFLLAALPGSIAYL